MVWDAKKTTDFYKKHKNRRIIFIGYPSEILYSSLFVASAYFLLC